MKLAGSSGTDRTYDGLINSEGPYRLATEELKNGDAYRIRTDDLPLDRRILYR
jgi:hypothetical protein